MGPGTSSEQARRGGEEPLRALLVEDNPGDAELVGDLLEHGRYEPVALERTTTLADTMCFLGGVLPDVVLLDVGLPDSQGLDTVKTVVRAAPDVPIVVLTGHDDSHVATEAVRKGAQEFLGKDMMTEALLERVIRHSIERQRLLAETQRQRQLAHRAEQEMRRLISANIDGIVVADGRGRVLVANEAARELLGTELVGRAFPYQDVDDGRELILREEERDPRVVELHRRPIEWGRGDGMLFVLRDVTERVSAERMRSQLAHADRLKSIGQLGAGVAHEVNNPASFVLANVEAMRQRLDLLVHAFEELQAATDGMPAEARERIDRLLQAHAPLGALEECREIVEEDRAGILRIHSIVRSLRAFARIDQEEAESLSLDEVVGDACTMARNEVRHRAELTVERGDVPRIAGHRGKLTQVLVNLLVNAAHAVGEKPAGERRIAVRTWPDAEGVHVAVEDTGPGIADATRARIFEPFYTSKSREEGAGLGLPMSAEIARQHGGELRVHSAEGQGSRFEVVLPFDTGLTLGSVAADGAAGATPGEQVGSAEPARAAPEARVLIIDDEPLLLKAFRRNLAKHYVVETAEGGGEGLERLEQDPHFDVVVCDLMMPEVDGVAVYEALAERAPRLLERMIFVSGGAFTERSQRFVEGVTNPVLEKPVSPDVLRATVSGMLGDAGAI